MTQDPKDTPEPPAPRALRMNTAAAAARQRPTAGKLKPERTGGMGAGTSKPWLKR
jgi:hypothetical protein